MLRVMTGMRKWGLRLSDSGTRKRSRGPGWGGASSWACLALAVAALAFEWNKAAVLGWRYTAAQLALAWGTKREAPFEKIKHVTCM